MHPSAFPRSFSPRSICLLGALLLLGLAPLILVPDAPLEPSAAAVFEAPKPQLVASYAKLPLNFEPNLGQTDPQVNFLSRGPGYSLFLTPTEAVLALRNPKLESRIVTEAVLTTLSSGHGFSRAETAPATVGALAPEESTEPPTVLRLKLLGANPAPRITGLDPLPGKVNYFLGNNPARWRTNLPTFARVRYQNLYPGIDLIYYGHPRQLPLAASNPARPALLGGVAPATGPEFDFLVAPGRSAAEIPVHRDAEASYHTGMGLEFDFVVSPGADPSLIRLAIDGADHLALDPNGDLILHLVAPASGGTASGGAASGGTGLPRVSQRGVSPVAGELRLHKPRIYQEINGIRHQIPGRFVLNSSPHGPQAAGLPRSRRAGQGEVVGHESPNTVHGSRITDHVGFELGPYDPTKPLIIDPVLLYSTYLGGSSADWGIAIAVDTAGNAYVTGDTVSTNFPTANPFLPTFSDTSGGADAFVAKLNATGSALLYSTYLGGSRDDGGRAIAVDAAGSAYVTGRTNSSNFPTATPFDATFGGGTCFGSPCSDGFVTKLSPTGSALIYSTYLGGSSHDQAFDITVDAAGNAYVTGTASTNFPTTQGAFRATGGGAFVTKLNPAGSGLVYSTFLSAGYGFGIAVDIAGNAYVVGSTTSTNFPTTVGAFDSTCGTDGNCNPDQFGARKPDAFVTELNASGSALVYSTYLGGSGNEELLTNGGDIAVDADGNAYVLGGTTSTDFPLANPLQPTFGGGADSGDAFVAKLNPTGSALIYSTYLGGSGDDGAGGIAVDAAGNAYVTGGTASTNFPTANPLQASCRLDTFGQCGDAFVAKLNPTGSALVYSTYLGGTSADRGEAIAVDAAGNAFVTGSTTSTNFPTANPAQPLLREVPDAFIAKMGELAPGDNPVPSLSSLSPSSTTAGGPAFTLIVTGSNFVSGAVVRWNGNNRTTSFVSGTQLTASIPTGDIAAAGTAQVTVFNPAPGGGTSNTLTFTILNPVPALSSLSPSSASVGGGALTLTITGLNFILGSVVEWNGINRTTAFVSSTELRASIPASDLAVPRIALVTLWNPAPGGGPSHGLLTFRITSTPAAGTILPSTPFTRVVPHVVTGDGFVTKMTLANLSAGENSIIVNFVSQAGALVETQTHTLAPAATLRIETLESARFTTPTIRWAVVGSQFAVGVNLFFELKGSASNAIITTVGFNDVPAVSAFTLPVELEPARTGDPAPRTVGLAIANVSNSTNTVTLRLHNQSGTLLATETMNLGPFAQNAFNVENLTSFRSALPTGNFIGTVSVSATQPLSAIGVGDDFGPFFSIPLMTGRAGTLLVPHVVTGDGFVTKMTVVNVSNSSNPITLKFFSQSGALLETQNFTLGPNASQRIATPESERFTAPTTRWATVEAQQPAGVNLFFELTQPASPLIVTTVGFNDVAGLAEFTLPVEFEPARAGDPAPRTVGLALANNSASSSSVTLKLLDRSGAVQATHNLTLNPFSQTAFNVENLSSFRPVVPAANFIGTLTVLATTPLSAIGVGDDFGPFFSIPIIPGRAR